MSGAEIIIPIAIAAAAAFFGSVQAAANLDSACSARKANQLRKNETLMGKVSNGNTRVQDYRPQPSFLFHVVDVEHNRIQIVGAQVPSGHGPMALQRLGEPLIGLEKEQQSSDTLQDTTLGMHTGKMPGYTREMAESHWHYFRVGSIDSVPTPTIAVVNWTEGVLTMWVYSPEWRLYHRNYHVVLLEADLKAFAENYCHKEVFSGIMKDSWLAAHNSVLTKVPKVSTRWMLEKTLKKVLSSNSWSNCVESSNSWSMLGIRGDIRGDPVFIQMKRGAVFGIIESRFQNPTLLNVDMLGGKRSQQFVKMDSEHNNLLTKGTSGFSVFSFSDNGWAEDFVLVG